MKRIWIIGIGIICWSWMATLSSVHAQTGEVGFSVEIVPHAKQLNPQVGYFDLFVSPAEPVVLELVIHNHLDKRQRYELDIGNAYTNELGVIVYDQSEPVREGVSFTDLVDDLHQTIEVGPSEAKRVKIEANAVGEMMEGVLLGGIRVSRTEDPATPEQVGVQNQYEYVIGVKLTTTTKQVVYEPKWESVSVNTNHYYPHVAFQIANQTGSISGQVDLEMRVESDEGKTMSHRMEARMAPYTSTGFRFPITERLAPGTYQVSVEMRERETNRTWSFTDSFKVTDEEAAHIQARVEEPVVQQSGFLNRDMTLPIVGICLLLSIGYILYLRRRLRSA